MDNIYILLDSVSSFFILMVLAIILKKFYYILLVYFGIYFTGLTHYKIIFDLFVTFSIIMWTAVFMLIISSNVNNYSISIWRKSIMLVKITQCRYMKFRQWSKESLRWIVFYFSKTNRYRTATLLETRKFLSSHDCIGVTDLIYADVESELNDYSKVKATINEGAISCDNLALLLIADVTFNKLVTGRYHIYRGLLSQQGKELMRFFLYANEQLVKNGIQSEENFQSDKKLLKKEISEIG